MEPPHWDFVCERKACRGAAEGQEQRKKRRGKYVQTHCTLVSFLFLIRE